MRTVKFNHIEMLGEDTLVVKTAANRYYIWEGLAAWRTKDLFTRYTKDYKNDEWLFSIGVKYYDKKIEFFHRREDRTYHEYIAFLIYSEADYLCYTKKEYFSWLVTKTQ